MPARKGSRTSGLFSQAHILVELHLNCRLKCKPHCASNLCQGTCGNGGIFSTRAAAPLGMKLRQIRDLNAHLNIGVPDNMDRTDDVN
jgi:hypothetical protein